MEAYLESNTNSVSVLTVTLQEASAYLYHAPHFTEREKVSELTIVVGIAHKLRTTEL